MKNKYLHSKRAILPILFILLLCVAGMTKTYAQEPNRVSDSQTNSEYEPWYVWTEYISMITSNSAFYVGGSYWGSNPILVKGACWSTHPNPTLEDDHTADSFNGNNAIFGFIYNLTPNTTYYLRTYVTDDVDTYYGNVLEFTTAPILPEVTTMLVSEITASSALCGGNVLDDGGIEVLEKGVCWSMSHEPTIDNDHLVCGSGIGSFEVTVTGFTENTKYYVRAYATNVYGVSYGEEVSFTARYLPIGAINGIFSVGEGQQVYFSQGNLQYQASTNTWKFAENQWDFVGENNNNISPTYNGWIDLFGWGTSGYDHGAHCYQPWSTSSNGSDYYAYGNPNYNLFDQTGKADWGYNAIVNGGNQENHWRVLKGEYGGEWDYLLNYRNTLSGIRFVKTCVQDVPGLVLFPDDWDPGNWVIGNANDADSSFYDGSFSQEVWTNDLEPAGVVFLPAAGGRTEYGYSNYNPSGYYWSSTAFEFPETHAQSFVIADSGISPCHGYYRGLGHSVRLVRSTQKYSCSINVIPNLMEGGTVTGAGTYEEGSVCTLTATANEGYAFANWTLNGMIVSHDAEYAFTVIGDMTLVANFASTDNIVFADDNVKFICVSNWDTNGDGELSYAEAASVTNLDYYFQYHEEITSFDELRYFIGLSSIGDFAFIGCSGLTAIEIPNSVTTIGNYAFYYCFGLTTIEITNSVTYIGSAAFYYCSGLTTIEIPNSVTAISDWGFSWCSGLTTVEIPNSVTFIGDYAFSNCSGLTTVEIPNSVTTIGNYAFYCCLGLQSLSVLSETPPILELDVFYGVDMDIPVYVPCGSAEVYQFAAFWNEFTNIQEVCPQSQIISLSEGWNWCSFNVEITLDDLKAALLEALPGTAISIKSQTQNTSYNPNNNRWVGSLAWDVSKMYMISVTAACEITLIGMPINPSEQSISIMNGANWIGFPHNSSMTLANAFAGFSVNGDRIKSQTNNALYNGIRWQGQLNALESGKGYIYISNSLEERTLTFPTSAK